MLQGTIGVWVVPAVAAALERAPATALSSAAFAFDERPPPAYGAVDLAIRIDEVCEVTDDNVLRINTDVLKDIELLDG
jgi:hypothetical protein